MARCGAGQAGHVGQETRGSPVSTTKDNRWSDERTRDSLNTSPPDRQHFEGLTKAKESGVFKMGGEFIWNALINLSLFLCLVGPRCCISSPLAVSLITRPGAILEDMPPDDEVSSMKFAGSTLMIVASSREEIIDMLKEDVYVKSGVWDLEKVENSLYEASHMGLPADWSL